MTIPWVTDTRDQISGIINEIGRDVTLFYVYSSYGCPICDLDPITNTSTDSFCETCSGDYWIDIMSGYSIKAHVTWKYDYENDFHPGGKVINGDARVKYMHTDAMESLTKSAKYFVVDGKILDIEKTTLLGAANINRISVDLKEREE